MKKFVVMLAAVVLAVSFCSVLCADEAEDENKPVPTWVDNHVKSMDLFSGGTKPQTHKKTTPRKKPQPQKQAKKIDGMHSEAKYVITKWSHNGDNYTLEVFDKSGRQEKDVHGRAGNTCILRMPIQFTIPDWVTQIHVDPKPNYEILDDGTLEELDYFEETDANGVVHKFRKAYSGDKVLLVNGDGLTLWIRKD